MQPTPALTGTLLRVVRLESTYHLDRLGTTLVDLLSAHVCYWPAAVVGVMSASMARKALARAQIKLQMVRVKPTL